MEYKGYYIVASAAGWVGAKSFGYLFSIYKKQGDEFVNIHASQVLKGSFPHEVFAFNAAQEEARALIDAGGPFTARTD